MVLDDVTGSTDAVVVPRSSRNADVLSHGDLDMGDVMVVPDGLENLVGEPERHDVLDGFLAQVVVDAEDRLRAERASDDLVEVSRAFQVMAEGLLDDDPAPMGRVVAGHAVALELAHHGLEGLRRVPRSSSSSRIVPASRSKASLSSNSPRTNRIPSSSCSHTSSRKGVRACSATAS